MGTIAPETKLLIAFLKKCHEENTPATYKEIDNIVSKASTAKRHYLSSALKLVKADYDILFQCIAGTGYRPLTNPEKVSCISGVREQKIKSQVEKWSSDISTVRTTELDETGYQEYLTSSIKLSAHQLLLTAQFGNQAQVAAKSISGQSTVNYSKEAIKALMDVS